MQFGIACWPFVGLKLQTWKGFLVIPRYGTLYFCFISLLLLRSKVGLWMRWAEWNIGGSDSSRDLYARSIERYYKLKLEPIKWYKLKWAPSLADLLATSYSKTEKMGKIFTNLKHWFLLLHPLGDMVLLSFTWTLDCQLHWPQTLAQPPLTFSSSLSSFPHLSMEPSLSLCPRKCPPLQAFLSQLSPSEEARYLIRWSSKFEIIWCAF